MKIKIMIFLVSSFLLAAGYPEKYAKAVEERRQQKISPESKATGSEIEKPSKDLAVREYEVFGMDCPGCHQGLEKLIKKIPAVLDAEANWKKKRVIVTIHPGEQLKDEDIYDAIKRANFTPGKRIE